MYSMGIQSYRKTDISTSDPVKLVMTCYEAAIDDLKLAKEKMKEKDYEKKAKAIIKAQDIIDELLCSLDFEKGGIIAANLSRLYNYMLRRIIHGDVNRDINAISEVIGMLNELLSAWQAIYLQKDIETRPVANSFSHNKKAGVSGCINV